MATYIGTNFNFEGKQFLDQRQGLAGTTEDLKNWSIVVPEGFELCLNGTWYYYDSSVTLEDTGHWIPRVTEELIENDNRAVTSGAVYDVSKNIESVREDLTTLDNTMYPPVILEMKAGTKYTSTSDLEKDRELVMANLGDAITAGKYLEEFDINQDGKLDNLDINAWNTMFNALSENISYTSSPATGTYWQEVGSFVLPRVTWKVARPLVTWKVSGSSIVWSLVPGSDSNIVPVKSAEVVGETKGIFDSNYQGWTSRAVLGSATPAIFKYTVSCKTNNGAVATESCNFGFGLRRYWCTGDISIWNSSSLDGNSLSKAYTTGGSFPETSFNCTGGKYPYLLVPAQYYKSSLNTYVNKNLNSDFLTKSVTVTNSVGVEIQYIMYRTNYIQTGNPINIEIK